MILIIIISNLLDVEMTEQCMIVRKKLYNLKSGLCLCVCECVCECI